MKRFNASVFHSGFMAALLLLAAQANSQAPPVQEPSSDNGGVIYDKDGVKVIHWQRAGLARVAA